MNSNASINRLHKARIRAALYDPSMYIRMNTITQKYAFSASLINNGENTTHQDTGLSCSRLFLNELPVSACIKEKSDSWEFHTSTLRVSKTVNAVKHTKAIQISNTVSPNHLSSSLNWKNIRMFCWNNYCSCRLAPKLETTAFIPVDGIEAWLIFIWIAELYLVCVIVSLGFEFALSQ